MEFLGLAYVTPFIAFMAFLVAIAGGLVKGLVGFAMPTVMISGLGSIVAPDIALAWLLLPTLVTNCLLYTSPSPRDA